MKIKKIICLALTVLMIASLASVFASAAELSIDQDYTGNKEFKLIENKPELVGAVKVHQMFIDGDAKGEGIGYVAAAGYNYWHEGVEHGGVMFDDPDTLKDLDISYVAYKVSADEGNCIDTLNLGINYIISGSNPNEGKYMQQAVYVLDRIDFENKKGKVSFADKTPVKILGGGWGYDGDHMKDPLNIDLTDAVKAFDGEKKTVYVVVAMFSHSGLMGTDDGRLSGQATQYNRLCGVKIDATETAATTAVSDPDDSICGSGTAVGNETAAPEKETTDTKTDETKANTAETKAENAEDNDSNVLTYVIIAAAVVVVAAVVAIVVTKSKGKKN